MTSTSDDREEFRAVLRGLLTHKSQHETVRAFSEGAPYDRELWSLLANQTGLAGLIIPEKWGGQGMGLREAAVALEEGARVLLCAPLLTGAVLAPTAVLAAADDAAAGDLLPGIADGSTVAVVALDDEVGRPTAATQVGGAWRLSGTKVRVLDGPAADVVLVVARTGEGHGLFAIDASADGIDVAETTSLDLTRRYARITLSDAEARRVGADFTAGLAELERVARFAASAEALGVAARMLEIAVDYVKTREQFGRVIGSFQAIKHMCSEMFVRVECSRGAVSEAAGILDDPSSDPAEVADVVAVTKAYCSHAVVFVAETGLQLHGGIGYTWEHVSHLYLRRAKTLELSFGSPLELRRELARTHGVAA